MSDKAAVRVSGSCPRTRRAQRRAGPDGLQPVHRHGAQGAGYALGVAGRP
ncbi:MAG: hypothetical protein WDN31_14210 [Hyphomicrobium sp.]